MNDERTPDDLREFVLLALYTGARRGDLRSMRWEDVQATATGGKFWHVPDPKNNKPYNIPLTPEALAVLQRRHARNGTSPWVFPNPAKPDKHVLDMKKSWTTLRKRAALPDVRMHDLRRTLGSWQAGLGTSLLIIGKSLGHASTGATEIYSRLNLDPVRASVQGAITAMTKAGRKRLKA